MVGASTDPWSQLEDIDGTALYQTLDVDSKATYLDIKKAYRSLARSAHPDKGGHPETFARIQAAYETLSDPKKREVYDAWAKELQFRYVRSQPAGVPLGGEDILLDEFEGLGLKCDPSTQLVVTCEVCRRPATKKCWTCSMEICEFCTLKRHWKGDFPLHWPLINSDHMKERLAKRELEKKRIEDAKHLALQDPNYRSDAELKDLRAFKVAAAEVTSLVNAKVTYDHRLGRFYMWAQTPLFVFIACRVPAGYADRELVVECSSAGLLIQSEGSPPLIDRSWEYSIDSNQPVETLKTEDNRFCLISLTKAQPGGEHWSRLFRGDSDGIRCLQPPYSLTETDEDAMLEITLPFWTESQDICVDIQSNKVSVDVRNGLSIHRNFWSNAEEAVRRRDYMAIDPDQSTWALDDDVDDSEGGGEKCKVLLLCLARPPPTEEEVMYKKGVRQDNRAAQRPGSMTMKGWRLFVEDEDEFGLENVLMGMCFGAAGMSFVPAKPWRPQEQTRWAKRVEDLPDEARSFVQALKSISSNGVGVGEEKEE
jgi:HSP20 family molecular chaperone IbpA